MDRLCKSHAMLSLPLLLGAISIGLHGCGGDDGVFLGTAPDESTVFARDDQDLLTVMSYNTYLLRINLGIEYSAASNLDERQAKTATWFQSLSPEAMPDVLVFQEIYSREAQDMLRTLCSPEWTKNEQILFGWHNHDPHIPCDVPDSPFGYATRCLNPRSATTVVKCGGVVVLVKKGIHMISSHDQQFEDCAGQTCLSARGFWAVTIKKGTQKYWVFGTHAIAYMYNAELRQKQFRQMRQYIDENVEDGARLVIAGDMNIATGPYKELHDGVEEVLVPNEYEPMLQILGHSGSPAMVGDLVPNGFWLPMDEPMNSTWHTEYNHVVAAYEENVREGMQTFDWVIAPAPGDRLASPVSMRWQVVPVKSDECFVTDESFFPEGTKTDDLSDHYGIFAELIWANDTESSTVVVQGHRGAHPNGTFPTGPTCED